jgi:hypothetical protein
VPIIIIGGSTTASDEEGFFCFLFSHFCYVATIIIWTTSADWLLQIFESHLYGAYLSGDWESILEVADERKLLLLRC